MDRELKLSAPERRLMLREARALVDLASVPFSLLGTRKRTVEGPPVIVLPGFGAGQRAMQPLRSYLRRNGFATEDWGLGKNRAGMDIRHTLEDLSEGWQPSPLATYRREGGVAYLVDRMVERVQKRSEAAGAPVSLVGWSLGGTIAREVARDAPETVRQVITLGSPFAGGPKYTVAGDSMRRKGLNVDWIEDQVLQRERRPVTVPITAVVSPTDAIVGYAAAQDRYSENVEHVELDVAHLGMGLNRKVWRLIRDRLAQSTD